MFHNLKWRVFAFDCVCVCVCVFAAGRVFVYVVMINHIQHAYVHDSGCARVYVCARMCELVHVSLHCVSTCVCGCGVCGCGVYVCVGVVCVCETPVPIPC